MPVIMVRVMTLMTLMMETEQVSERGTLVQLTQLIAGERFSEYVCWESFNSCLVLIA
jgi:neutral trehalase